MDYFQFCAVIPARGGSKGIPGKNCAPLCGKPLISYTIKAALSARCLSHVYVTSDSQRILDVAESYGAEPIKRPDDLSTDDSTTVEAVRHAIEYCADKGRSYRYVVVLQPTSPLRNSKHIEEACELLISQDGHSLVSCVRLPHIFNPDSVFMLDGIHAGKTRASRRQASRRQEKPVYYARNGAAIYISRTSELSANVFSPGFLVYEMSKIESIDIDDPDDLWLAEAILSQKSK
jgi:CMP-N,N'-diacetyllegionaminic acid synthase